MLQYQIVPVTAYEQNACVLWCSETKIAVVTDPGGDLELLENVLSQKRLQLKYVLLTHGHFDHAGCAGDFAKQQNVPIIGPHKEDMFWISALPEQYQRFGLAGKPTAFVPDKFLDDGEVVEFGNIKLEVFHCPGHTPGHVVFYHREGKFAIVGDVIFQGSIGRTDFPRGNHHDLINAIRVKLFPLGNDVKFIPGHGPMSTFGEERKSNPYVGDAVCE